MAPNKHAVLSASSSHRWLNCSPSARLEQEFKDRETEAAAEGTAAHALCEHKLKRTLKMRSRKPVSQYDCDEMDEYTDAYVQFVLETLAEARQIDAKTIWNFRDTLSRSEVIRELFDAFNQQLEEAHIITREGSIVDATFVDAPRQRNTRAETPVSRTAGYRKDGRPKRMSTNCARRTPTPDGQRKARRSTMDIKTM